MQEPGWNILYLMDFESVKEGKGKSQDGNASISYEAELESAFAARLP